MPATRRIKSAKPAPRGADGVLIDIRDERGRFVTKLEFSAAQWTALIPVIRRSGKGAADWLLETICTATERDLSALAAEERK